MKMLLVVLFVAACGAPPPVEASFMSQKPIRYPGAVLSRNSQTRAAAQQAGSYAVAAAGSPSTIGFGLFAASPASASGEFRMGRIHGLLTDDVIMGYVVQYQGVVAAAVTGQLIIRASLYQVDANAVLRQIPASVVSFNDGAPTPLDLPNKYLFIPATAFTVDPQQVILAAVEFDYTPGDWTNIYFTGFDALNFLGAAVKGTGGMTSTVILPSAVNGSSAVVPSIAVVTQRNIIFPPNNVSGYVLF